MTAQNKTKPLFHFLQEICPNGLELGFACISWEVIQRIAIHWCKTGENQYKALCELLRLESYVRTLKNGRFSIANDFKQMIFTVLHDLFQDRYVFDIKDITSDVQEAQWYKDVYDYLLTRMLPQTPQRRTEACRVTSLKSVRQAVFERDNHRCVFCGSTERLTVDHIIPITQGGADVFENFQALCHSCNSAKSDKLQEAPAR